MKENFIKVFLSPHSHIDITWWDKPETCRERILQIIDKVIYLSNKYPDYRFSLETTLPIYFYLCEFPEKINEIKKIIKNRNLEIGGLYVSLIPDICIDEVIIRNLYFGKKYLIEILNYNVDFAKEEDVPGHTYQFPQILSSAGIKYFKISRGPQSIFLWSAKNDDKVLTCLINYGAIAQKRQKNTESIISAINKFLDKSKNIDKIEYSCILLPAGDDMEIPDEKIIDAKNLWNIKFKQPEIIFGNFSEFMKEVENFDHRTLKGDIPNIWAMLATMEEQIVKDLISLQRNLSFVEKFSAFSHILEMDYPDDEINKIYRIILTAADHNWGSRDKHHFGEECDRYKWKLVNDAEKINDEILKTSLNNICSQISFKNEGIPIVVFNPLSHKRTDVVECELERGNYILKDSNGIEIPYQFEGNKIVFIAKDVSSIGYKTYYLYSTDNKINFDTEIKINKNKIENRFYKIEISSAGIEKLYSKSLKHNFMKKINLISAIDKNLIISFLQNIIKLKLPKFIWNILGFIFPFLRIIASFVFRLKFNTGEIYTFTARFKPAPEGFYEKEEVEGVGEEVEIGKEVFKGGNYKDVIITGREGAVRKSIISKSKFIDESEKQVEIVIYNEIQRIDYNVSILWQGRDKTIVNIAFPFNVENSKTTIDIPFCLYKLGEEVSGFWDHPENIAGFKARGIQDFINMSNNNFGIILSSSWPCFDFTFFPNCNLLYSDSESGFFFGDFYRKCGFHKFTFSLYPHSGDCVNAKSWIYGKYLNYPLVANLYKEKNTSGILSDELSFCEILDDNIIINCVKKAEKGNSLIVRFYEIEGKENNISIKFNFKILSAYLCDVLENEKEKLELVDNIIKIKVKPYNIYTIKTELYF